MVVITIDMTAYGSRAVSLTFCSDDMAENFGRSLLHPEHLRIVNNLLVRLHVVFLAGVTHFIFIDTKACTTYLSIRDIIYLLHT